MSTSTTGTSTIPADILKKYPNYSTDELQSFQMNQASYFKGTIAVCVIYGVFAAGLIAVAAFSSAGKSALADEFMPFLVTFVIGVIVIIFLLVISITTMKPSRFVSTSYDRFACPDYWKLQKVDITNSGNLPLRADENIKSLYGYKCVPNTEILPVYEKTNPADATNIYGNNIVIDTNDTQNSVTYATIDPTNGTDTEKALGNVAGSLFEFPTNKLQGVYNNIAPTDDDLKSRIRCDEIFPAVFAAKDEGSTNGNALRCAWRDKCNVTWSGICPK